MNFRSTQPEHPAKMTLPGFKLAGQRIVEGNGDGLKTLLTAGMQQLEKHVQFLNRLNVFPVPDGDTGANMFLTLRAAVDNATKTASPHAGQIAADAAGGALMGARGNSGVILSQLLQGMAQHLAGKPFFSASDFSKAWQLGVKLAYQGVVEPVEGTILTVAAAAQRIGPPVDDLTELLTAMLTAAKIAQADTPNRLPVLKEAGVTDAGGQGLVYVLTGMVHALTGLPPETESAGPKVDGAPPDFIPADYGYDVQFLLYGTGLDVAAIRTDIQQMGQSTVVVGNDRLVKVHVHTADPGHPLSYGAQHGALGDVVVENMTRQAVAQHALIYGIDNGKKQQPGLLKKPMSANNEIQILAIAPGQGFVEIFNSLGVSHTIVSGRRHNINLETMQADLAEFSAGPVLILPDSIKAFRVAYQAKQQQLEPWHIIPSRSVVQGIAAALAFNRQADIETNLRRMTRVVTETRTLTIARAGRATITPDWEIQPGDFLAVLDGCLTAVSAQINIAVLDSFGKIDIDTEVVALYFGRAVEPAQADALAFEISTQYPELEIEVHYGAQPYYDYIISLE